MVMVRTHRIAPRMLYSQGCQIWVGKYLETLGVEPGVGGIWGGEGPQCGIML